MLMLTIYGIEAIKNPIKIKLLVTKENINGVNLEKTQKIAHCII